MCWIAALSEVATIIAIQVPSLPTSRWVLSTLVIKGSPGASRIAITFPCFCGSLLVTFGAFLRFQCYQSLGKLFTFELSIHKDHALITTGPYSIVRHPSYTGAIMVLTGTFIVNATRGSWLRECGGWKSAVGKVFIWLWVAAAVSSVSGVVLRRIPGEDAAMKRQFGKEWDEWAHRVRYRLIPGVYWYVIFNSTMIFTPFVLQTPFRYTHSIGRLQNYITLKLWVGRYIMVWHTEPPTSFPLSVDPRSQLQKFFLHL